MAETMTRGDDQAAVPSSGSARQADALPLSALSAAAPGRVNLIGEHTDYTGGFVMPMAIDFETVASITPLEGRLVELVSENFGESVTLDLDRYPEHGHGHWSDYPAGVIAEMRSRQLPLTGFRLALSGDVPLGAGLSSSASVEVATAVAVLQSLGTSLPPAEIATLCRAAENDFVGGSCGIMDQFVITSGIAGHALLLDCRSLVYEQLPIPDSVKIVICNSTVKHTVAHGEYGNRNDEVMTGQRILAAARPGVRELRDATLADLEACRDAMSPEVYKRCRHVITENARVLRARAALQAHDLVTFGELMREAHVSFRDDFQASCMEVDTLVEIADTLPGCFGARITGGGFGGCTVNLVAADDAERFRDALVAGYQDRLGIAADCYISRASDGAVARLK